MNCNPTNNTDCNQSINIKTEPNDDDRNDNQSTTSSTDDYVRELLDPNDRPRNVWHVVEGPKLEPDDDGQGEGYAQAENNDDHDHVRDDDDNNNNNNQPKTSPLPSPPPPPPPPPPPEGDEDAEDAAPRQAPERQEEDPGRERRSPQSVGDRTSDRDRTERSSSLRHHRHHDDGHRDRDRHRDHDRVRDNKDPERDRERDRDRSRDRSHRRDRRRDDHHRSSRRRRDYSDDEDDRGSYHRYRSDRRHGSRSSRRDRSVSRTSSSRRPNRSRSNSHSPLTKRNSRTILIMQLNPRVTSDDLEDFFAGIGKVKEVRLIMDSKTRKHKGIAYIEFEDTSTAAKAFSLNGQEFFGAPINIQSAHSDRIRSSGDWHSSSSTSHTNHHNQSMNYHHHASTHSSSRSNLPPNCYRVYVGGLHVNLTEEMLRSLFEPFGPIIRLELMRDRATNVSRGYAFITYANTDDGQEAVRCLDGFELAGKPMRVSKSTDKSERHTGADSINAS